MANRFLAQANTDEPPSCPGCKQWVLPKDRPVSALKATWHPGCLKCTSCGTTLNTRSLESYENKPYCRAHRPNPSATQVKATDNVQMATAMAVPKAARKEQGIDKTSRMTFAPGQLPPQADAPVAASAREETQNRPQPGSVGSIKDRIAQLSVQDNSNQNQQPARPAPQKSAPAAPRAAAPPPQKSAPPPQKSAPPPQRTAPPASAPPPQKFAPPPPKKQPEPEPEPEPEWQEEQPAEESQQDWGQEQAAEETYQAEEQQQDWGQEQQQQQDWGQEQQQQQDWGQEEQQQQDWGQEEQPQQEWGNEGQQEASYGIGQCRALYDFAGENETDLSFSEGDVIVVHDKSDPSGWWEGELNGVRGFFPSNFVEES